MTRMRLGLALLCLSLTVVSCSGWRNSGRGVTSTPYNGRGANTDPAYRSQLGSPSTDKINQPSRRGLGVSAWGIVAIIMSMIVAGMCLYYFSMCYPLLCKKERNYDMIEKESTAV